MISQDSQRDRIGKGTNVRTAHATLAIAAPLNIKILKNREHFPSFLMRGFNILHTECFIAYSLCLGAVGLFLAYVNGLPSGRVILSGIFITSGIAFFIHRAIIKKYLNVESVACAARTKDVS